MATDDCAEPCDSSAMSRVEGCDVPEEMYGFCPPCSYRDAAAGCVPLRRQRRKCSSLPSALSPRSRLFRVGPTVSCSSPRHSPCRGARKELRTSPKLWSFGEVAGLQVCFWCQRTPLLLLLLLLSWFLLVLLLLLLKPLPTSGDRPAEDAVRLALPVAACPKQYTCNILI